jgi:type II secretory pathway pseudopilin PulG
LIICGRKNRGLQIAKLTNYTTTKFSMKVSPRSQFVVRRASDEQGYVLLTLILFVALLAVAMTVMAPVISQQVKRDREEELIHRGVQYSRAIKHFVKKFGRYPTKIEDLESTNNVRFLRKRYKDPITGKDFKILHLGEVQTSFGPGIAGATSVANLAAASQATGGAFGNSAFGNNSSFGGSTLGGNNLGGSSFGGSNPGGSGFGGSAFGGFSNSGPASTNSAQPSGTNAAPGNPQTNPDQSPGTDATAADQQVSGQPGQANQVFGGGPIVGVASVSKEKSIRVFNKKEHYYQWQFIYDPSTDTGGLLSTPNQPGLQSLGGGLQQGLPGQGQPGMQNSAFGTQGSPFGFQGGTQMPPGGMQPMQPAPSQQPPQGPQSAFPPDQAPQQ